MNEVSALGVKDEVLGVRLDEDNAVMEVRFNGHIRRMTVTRERGEWEIQQGTPRYYGIKPSRRLMY